MKVYISMAAKKQIMTGLLILFWILSFTYYLCAQAAEAPQPQERNIFTILFPNALGAVCMIPLLFCSVAMVALIIENLVSIQKDKLAPPGVIADLENLLNDQNIEEALSLCESEKNYITNTVGVGLVKISEGSTYTEAVDTALQAIDEENLKLHQKISWLALIGNVGPMLGLFGTVLGMVSAFMEIERKGNPTPSELAGGIYTALVTTVVGLIVAIPSLAAYFWFRNRVSRFTFEMSSISLELIDRVKELAKK